MIDNAKMLGIMKGICEDLVGREQELCKLDAVVGDGDHGTTVKKAFSSILEAYKVEPPNNIGDIFIKASMAMSNTMGGAIGPIFGSMLMGMGLASRGLNEVDTNNIADMFEGALNKVQMVGGAQVGDKTLVDALYPAVMVLNDNRTSTEKEALILAADAAYKGAQGTKNLVSKKGRSHNLGENSKGYVDAGSMTMYYFIRKFADLA